MACGLNGQLIGNRRGKSEMHHGPHDPPQTKEAYYSVHLEVCVGGGLGWIQGIGPATVTVP